MTAPLILIAEDSPTQSAQLQHLLQQAGYRVQAAVNGQKALEAAALEKPRLVISDVDMPLMDGYALCRHTKLDRKLRGVPIILLTSMSDPEDVLRGLEAGANYYLTKPYQNDYLLFRVAEILADPFGDVGALGAQQTMQVVVNGQSRSIAADPRQVLTLLLSTYSDAVQRNRELIESQRQLNRQNQLLDQAAQSERKAHDALKQTQAQLVQSEKMAGLGQLVAGIAHEINNPLAFVSNNHAVLSRDLSFLKQLLELYAQATPAIAAQPELLQPIQEFSEKIDLSYTLKNLDELLDRSREGLRRISQIVTDLRDFVRLDASNLKEADLNPGIESTINIIRSRAKSRQIALELDLAPLPPVACYPAKINQVVMNLVANAIDASHDGGKVVVRSRPQGPGISIAVIDQGSGIPDSARDKIFDPFFTTKPPGKGTGLGLSISYGIIRDHGGRIEVQSTPGQGSTFTIHLPQRPEKASQSATTA